MSRTKKKRRHVSQYIQEDAGPTKAERLANPGSYEARKRKALKESKKPKSVYQKELEKQEAAKKQDSSDQRKGGRLADKIRKLNAEKKDD